MRSAAVVAVFATLAVALPPLSALAHEGPDHADFENNPMDLDIVKDLPVDVDRAPEAVKSACSDQTKAGQPTIAYLACVRQHLADHPAATHKLR